MSTQRLRANLEGLRVGHGHRALGVRVQDDGLDLLGAHDRAHAAAPGGTARTALGIGKLDGGGGEALLPGRADHGGDDLFAELGLHQLVRGVVVHAHNVGAVLELHGVLLHQDVAEAGARLGLVFQDDGEKAEPGQLVRELAANVGFLDAAGERRLGAHGRAAGVGRRAARQNASGDDQLVGGGKRMAAGGNLCRHHAGGERPAAEPGVLAQLLETILPGAGVDAQYLRHGVCSLWFPVAKTGGLG
jgi:hypothetical protein